MAQYYLELGDAVEGGGPGGLARVGIDAVEGEEGRLAAVQPLQHLGHLVHVPDFVHAVPLKCGMVQGRPETPFF